MTEDEAMKAFGHLIGGIGGYTDANVDEYTAQFEKLSDAVALEDVCDELARTWAERWKPSVAEVLTRYWAHPAVKRDRDDRIARVLAANAGSTFCGGSGWIREGAKHKPCPRCNPFLSDLWQTPKDWERWMDGTPLHTLHAQVTTKGVEGSMPGSCKADTKYDRERIPSSSEGQAIADDEYVAVYGRAPGSTPSPNPQFIVDTVTTNNRRDRRGNLMFSFPELVDAFRGDQARLRASLKALGDRVVWARNGMHGTLRRDEDEPVVPPAPRTEPSAPWRPRDPSEPSQDAGDLMRDALATIGRRMDDE